MATTQYNELIADVSLDVEPIFTDLMKASTGRGSAYLKAKETVIDYAANSNLTEIEKATLVSQTVTQLAQSVTNEAMQVALKIAEENRDAPYKLAKLKEDTRLVTAEIANAEKTNGNMDKDNQIKTMQIRKAQAELYRDYGVNSNNLNPDSPLDNITFTEYGTKVETIKMSQANVYNGYATAFRQNGLVTLATDSTGNLTAGTVGDASGLTYWQTKVAERQEQGFDDNTRQHVANSSATMISMLLSSGDSSLSALAQPALDKWSTAVNYLNSPTSRPAGAILIASVSTVSITDGFTINGTATALDGFGLTITMSKVSGSEDSDDSIEAAVSLVLLDGTWVSEIDPSKLSNTATDDVYKVTVSTLDQRGDLVSADTQVTMSD